MAGAAAGFNPTAALTTSTVVCLSFLASAMVTNSADLAGSSAAVTVDKLPKKGLAAEVSPALTLTASAKATAAVKHTMNFRSFINLKTDFSDLIIYASTFNRNAFSVNHKLTMI